MEQNEKKELRSLNVELPTLYVEELEQRLETDPLAIGGLLSGDLMELKHILVVKIAMNLLVTFIAMTIVQSIVEDFIVR